MGCLRYEIWYDADPIWDQLALGRRLYACKYPIECNESTLKNKNNRKNCPRRTHPSKITRIALKLINLPNLFGFGLGVAFQGDCQIDFAIALRPMNAPRAYWSGTDIQRNPGCTCSRKGCRHMYRPRWQNCRRRSHYHGLHHHHIHRIPCQGRCCLWKR